MKTLLMSLTCLVVMSFGAARAQKTFQFSAGPAVSIPVGDLSTVAGFGVGVELSGAYKFSESVEAFGQVGFHNFFGKSIDLGGATFKTGSTNHFPFLVGARYHSKVIAGAGVGYGLWEGEGAFTFSPQLGIDLGKIDLLGHYTSSTKNGSNLSYVGLKAFYKF